jgi:hypothetical protein
VTSQYAVADAANATNRRRMVPGTVSGPAIAWQADKAEKKLTGGDEY